MPRTARTISASGYYHIIARGIGKQILFEEDEDYLFFLRLMKNYSSSGEFSVTAFCLMENHVHILAKIADGMMDKVMHNLLATYATYYNKKYDRIGHLYTNIIYIARFSRFSRGIFGASENFSKNMVKKFAG